MNTDKVVCGFPIPQGGSLNGVNLQCHFIGPEGEAWNTMSMYRMSGFVIPVLDPDSGATFDAIWDAQIPKDESFSEGGFDIDTGAADVDPEWEIGVPDMSAVMDLVAGNPIEIFRRRKYLTIANEANTRDIVTGSADLKMVTDYFTTKVRRKVNCSKPSVVLFAVSSPEMSITSTDLKAIPAEAEWSLLQYLEVALEQAFMALVGLLEAALDEPYTSAMNFIAELIEDVVFEQSAQMFSPTQWRVFTIATFDISVPGRIALAPLSSE